MFYFNPRYMTFLFLMTCTTMSIYCYMATKTNAQCVSLESNYLENRFTVVGVIASAFVFIVNNEMAQHESALGCV